MSAQSIIITCALSCCIGLVCGYIVGDKHGRAVGWVEKFFDDCARDRARRDAAGRFARKAKP